MAVSKNISKVSTPFAWLAIVSSMGVLVLLIALHFLSPEFQPSWRMVSEYANGDYSIVLSLMFATWAISSWSLAYAIKSEVTNIWGKIGLLLLVVSGVGELMAAFFDITHSLHSLASLLGIGTLPFAAKLISYNLISKEGWANSKKLLTWMANFTWISVILMGASFGILIYTVMQAGIDVSSGQAFEELPEGVIGIVGYANRFLIVMFTAWIAKVAWVGIKKN